MSHKKAVPSPSSRVSPPLGRPPRPAMPPEVPGQVPHPGRQAVPMTDGTPAACYQKNAADFLAGDVQTCVMAHYAHGLFSTEQALDSREPAPDDPEAVKQLVRLREELPYG